MVEVSDYVAPPSAPPVPRIAILESDQGRLILTRNRLGYGYRLGEESTGFGPGDVDNELIPRLGQRGAMLGAQRQSEGDMELQIFLNSTSTDEIRRMAGELTKILKPADGTARIILSDPVTGEGRYREIAYRAGLKNPVWSSPYGREYKITVDYMDPWAYSTQQGQAYVPVAFGASGGVEFPIEFPVEFAESGATDERWGTNLGEKPAPVTLRFDGPARNPEVTLQGHWTFRIRGTLAWDEYLVITPELTNPTAYVYSKNISGQHRSAHNMISTGSRFTDLVIPPGQHAFSFTAIDDTYTASMTASWPHTYASMI